MDIEVGDIVVVGFDILGSTYEVTARSGNHIRIMSLITGQSYPGRVCDYLVVKKKQKVRFLCSSNWCRFEALT